MFFFFPTTKVVFFLMSKTFFHDIFINIYNRDSDVSVLCHKTQNKSSILCKIHFYTDFLNG
jgi:hypothetical protein